MSPRETSRTPTSFHRLPCNTNLSGQSITRQWFHTTADAMKSSTAHANSGLVLMDCGVVQRGAGGWRESTTNFDPTMSSGSVLELVVLRARISERQFCIEFQGTYYCGRLISEVECDKLGLSIEVSLSNFGCRKLANGGEVSVVGSSRLVLVVR